MVGYKNVESKQFLNEPNLFVRFSSTTYKYMVRGCPLTNSYPPPPHAILSREGDFWYIGNSQFAQKSTFGGN